MKYSTGRALRGMPHQGGDLGSLAWLNHRFYFAIIMGALVIMSLNIYRKNQKLLEKQMRLMKDKNRIVALNQSVMEVCKPGPIERMRRKHEFWLILTAFFILFFAELIIERIIK
jgi:hypothetical protein